MVVLRMVFFVLLKISLLVILSFHSTLLLESVLVLPGICGYVAAEISVTLNSLRFVLADTFIVL